MAQRRLELDSALAEKSTLLLVWNGREYNLPGAVPAKAVLKYLPLINEETGIPPAMIGEFMADLVGPDIYTELLDAGISLNDLSQVTTWLLGEYGLTPDSEKAESVAPGPNL